MGSWCRELGRDKATLCHDRMSEKNGLKPTFCENSKAESQNTKLVH